MDNQLMWGGINLSWAYSDLLNSITFKTTCVQRSRDILHDALVRFAISKNPQREESPHAYLRGIVSHLLIDEYRYHSKFISYDAETITPHDFAHSPEQLAEIKERLYQLQRVVDNLPAKCRQVFWLFHVDGTSHKEIASMLNISVNMVERHIIRAMLDLRAARQLIL
jgi:RNA polymerase sigma factor (sigma-70 family)